MEKTVPMGRLHMRPFQWYLKTHWKYPQSLDKKILCSEILERHLIWWKNKKTCFERFSLPCRGTQSPVVHRCICQGLGCTFGKPDSQWNMVGHRGKFAYKHSGIESSVFGNKVLSNPSNEQDLEGLGGLGQCNSSVLPQQARGGTHSWEMYLRVQRLMAF